MKEEKEEVLKYFRKRRKQSWADTNGNPDYIVTAGIDNYNKHLPPYKGQTLFDWINKKLESNYSLALLDIGCGSGKFLSELKRETRQKGVNFYLYGITGHDYRNKLLAFNFKEIQQVDYKIADIAKLPALFKGEAFDFITAHWVFPYLGNPLATLRHCYRLLKKEGILFITDTGLSLTEDEANRLNSYWLKSSILSELSLNPDSEYFSSLCNREVLVYNLAIQKNDIKKLPLPFSLNPKKDYSPYELII